MTAPPRDLDVVAGMRRRVCEYRGQAVQNERRVFRAPGDGAAAPPRLYAGHANGRRPAMCRLRLRRMFRVEASEV